ncbi:MAG: hypothetical protein AB1403_26510, partial [Candidatus Riflebacteria bacterium]
LESHEVLFLNSLARFLDVKPEGKALKPLENALRSKNPCVKGVGALILYRHYGRQFKRIFETSFTLNRDIDKFEQEPRKLIKLQSVNLILADLENALGRLKDDRLRRLFLFFHFRQIDLWLLGGSSEKLSMASFYRISSLDSVFGPSVDVIRIAGRCDRIEK